MAAHWPSTYLGRDEHTGEMYLLTARPDGKLELAFRRDGFDTWSSPVSLTLLEREAPA